MFEQSGTFKNEFIKLGIPAFDYDIQNNFGQTDYQIDLFEEIEKAYSGGASLFDDVTKDDLIMAFFPCTYFSDMSQILHTWGAYPKRSVRYATEHIIERSRYRQKYYELSIKMLTVASEIGLRLIMENPWGHFSYIKNAFVIPPTLIDKNRSARGDIFRKPTAYWFINCKNTNGCTIKPNKIRLVKKDARGTEKRSMISPDYARNFICDFILGKKQNIGQLQLF